MSIPIIRSITDLARDAKALVAEVQRTQEPMVITQRGREAAALVPVEFYRRLDAAAQPYRILTPRLVHREDAALFKMTVDNRYTGVFEHIGEWWIGHVEELPG